MTIIKPPLNWEAVKVKAKCMSAGALEYAILDILRTLPYSDALDREDQGNRGGYYRDEISVYRAELKER